MIALMVPADMPPVVQVLRQSAVHLERQHGYIRTLQMAGQVARVDTFAPLSQTAQHVALQMGYVLAVRAWEGSVLVLHFSDQKSCCSSEGFNSVVLYWVYVIGLYSY